MLEGLFTLGTSSNVAFTSPSSLPELNNDWMEWTTSDWITSQDFLKTHKSSGYPNLKLASAKFLCDLLQYLSLEPVESLPPFLEADAP